MMIHEHMKLPFFGVPTLTFFALLKVSKALDVHHNVIREVIDRHKAYEVKTIGDSFMVALSSADAAVLLANDIQVNLLNADWPLELASMPCAGSEFVRRGRDTPTAVYRGLRVRIGVHLGTHSAQVEDGNQVQTKYDNVAKGYDYYGPAVNAASRIEALAFGGQTLISSETHDQLSQHVKDVSTIQVVGCLPLKGIEDDVFVYQILPKDLKGRTFKGVFRRRDSDGGTFAGMSTNGSLIEGSSFTIGNEYMDNEDMMGDVMNLTPVQLQKTVNRLRNKVTSLEDKLLGAGRRISDEDLGMEDVLEDVSNLHGETVSKNSAEETAPLSQSAESGALYD